MASNVNDPELPTVYANTLNISVGPSEISLIFGTEFSSGDANAPIFNALTRIVITHDQFMRMMLFLQSRFDFLFRAYGDKIPENINDIAAKDTEAFAKLVQEYLIALNRPSDASDSENMK